MSNGKYAYQGHNGKDLKSWLTGLLLLTLCVSIAGIGGLWSGASRAIEDKMVQWSQSWQDEYPQVVLMQGAEASFHGHAQRWRELLEQLLTLGATQVVLLKSPEHQDPQFYNAARDSGRVILARMANYHPLAPEQLLIAEAGPHQEGLPYGLLTLGPSSQGAYRRQYLEHSVASQATKPSVEALAAARLLGQTAIPKGSSFNINFNFPLSELPQIRLEQALAGNLLREMISGRSILIAPAQELDSRAIHSPISRTGQLLAQPAYHAYALNTLLTGTPLRSYSAFELVLATFIASALALISYQRLPDQWSVHIAVAGPLLYGVIAWTCLVFAQLQFPLIETVVAHILGLTLMRQRRGHHMRVRTLRLLRHLSGRIEQRYSYQSYTDSEVYWTQVVNLVTQLFDMERTIFLERVPGDHRLAEVKAHNCSLEDIVEQRRDYERTPYSTALEKNGTYRLERPYLTVDTPAREQEIQYLIPLRFGGKVLGFWACSLLPRKNSALSSFEQMVDPFAHQIAEMLHMHQRWLEQQHTSPTLVDWVSREGGDMELVAELEKSAFLLDEQLTSMEQVFNGQETGEIFYNLFGNVLHINQRMSELAEAMKIPVFSMTAMDLLGHLTALGVSECRDLLRRVTLEQDNVFLPAAIEQSLAQNFVLHVRPLRGTTQTDFFQHYDPGAPFQVRGVLIELIDVSQIRRFQQQKALVADRAFTRLRQELGSCLQLTEQLQGPTVTQQKSCADQITARLGGAMHVINQVEQVLNDQSVVGHRQQYPCDLGDALHQALRNLEKEQAQQRVGIELHINAIESLVQAVQEQLISALEAIVLVLLRDAAQRSLVSINGHEQDGQVILHFTNQGFGIPGERFQDYLYGEASPSSEEYRMLRRAIQAISSWGGNIEAHSELGSGISVTLTFNALFTVEARAGD